MFGENRRNSNMTQLGSEINLLHSYNFTSSQPQFDTKPQDKTGNQIIKLGGLTQKNYKRRSVKTSRASRAGRDHEKPDTIDNILGFVDCNSGANGDQKTKVNMKQVKKRLKQEEIEAWVETTKNLADRNLAEVTELSALNKLIRGFSLGDEPEVDVKVIDRRKEEYMTRIKQGLDKTKDLDPAASNPQARKELQEMKNQRLRGVKAF